MFSTNPIKIYKNDLISLISIVCIQSLLCFIRLCQLTNQFTAVKSLASVQAEESLVFFLAHLHFFFMPKILLACIDSSESNLGSETMIPSVQHVTLYHIIESRWVYTLAKSRAASKPNGMQLHGSALHTDKSFSGLIRCVCAHVCLYVSVCFWERKQMRTWWGRRWPLSVCATGGGAG